MVWKYSQFVANKEQYKNDSKSHHYEEKGVWNVDLGLLRNKIKRQILLLCHKQNQQILLNIQYDRVNMEYSYSNLK